MIKELTNADVYVFLAEECRNNTSLWEQYGEGIVTHTTDVDFWNALSEQLDCFRICDECGKPMIEGYVVDGYLHYCSKECMLKHLTWEQYLDRYDDGEGDSFWTTWYEESETFRELNRK